MFRLFPKLGVNLDECRNGKGDDTKEHDNDEERLVAHRILDPSRHHARKHQSKIGQSGANGVMRRLKLTLAIIEHIECEGGESQTIAKLLDEETGTDEPQIARL